MSVPFPVDLTEDSALEHARVSVSASSCLTVQSAEDPRLYDEVALNLSFAGGHNVHASGQVVRFVPGGGGFEVYLLPASLKTLKGVLDGSLSPEEAARTAAPAAPVVTTAAVDAISIDAFMGSAAPGTDDTFGSAATGGAAAGPPPEPPKPAAPVDLDAFDPIPSEFDLPTSPLPTSPSGGGGGSPGAAGPGAAGAGEIELDGFDEFIIDDDEDAKPPPAPASTPDRPLFQSRDAAQAKEPEPDPEPEPEPVPVSELLNANSDVPVGAQFQALELVDQLRLAREGDQLARSVAIRFGNKRLHIDVVQNRSITLDEIATLTSRPGLTERAIRWIIADQRMVSRRDIVMNLVVNPATPRSAALKAVRVLQPVELAHLVKCPWTPKAILKALERRLEESGASAR